VIWAVVPVTYLAARNSDEPGIVSQAQWPLFIAAAAALLLTAVLGLLLRRLVLAAALATLGVLFFYGYGMVHEAASATGLEAPTVLSRTLGRQAVLLPVALVLLAALAALAWLNRNRLHGIMRAVAITGGVVVLINLVLLVQDSVSVGSSTVETPRAQPAATSVQLPDIYYIIVDGYGREDVLKEAQGFDNGPFTAYLRSKGFLVHDGAVSNYANTQSSIPATLNMVHVAGLSQGEVIRLRTLPREQTAVAKQARALGYEFQSIDSSDWNLGVATAGGGWRSHLATPFSAELASNTLLRVVWGRLLHIERFWTLQGTGRNLPRVQERVAAIALDPRPTFTVNYNLPPHAPYLFRRDGSESPYADVYNVDPSLFYEEWASAYVEQIEYLNSLLVRTIDTLIADSPQPPVIIIQSDHGPARLHVLAAAAERSDGPREHWERLGILSAYLMPPQCAGAAYEGMTPVNTFRSVFKACFGIPFDMLPDTSHWSLAEDDFGYPVVDPHEYVAE
jgi:hypothetical protein